MARLSGGFTLRSRFRAHAGKTGARRLRRGYAGPMETLIKKLVNVKSGEVKALLWSFAYFFFLLSTYYMLLPLRDAMGIEGGTRDLAVAVHRHVRRDADHRAVAGGAGGAAAAVAFHAGRLPVPRREHAGVLAADARRACRRSALRAHSSSGSPCSPYSPCRCSGRSWPTSTPASRASGCSASSVPADRSGRSSVRMITRQLVEPIGVANLLLVVERAADLAVVCANRLGGARAEAQAANPDSRPRARAARRPSAAACSMASRCCSSRPTWAASACGSSCCPSPGTMLYFVQAEVVSACRPPMRRRAPRSSRRSPPGSASCRC